MIATTIRRPLAAALAAIAAATGAVALTGAGSAGATSEPNQGLPQGSEQVDLNPAEFTTQITNPYFPLKPGNRWVYRETATGDPEQKVVVKVLERTKTIANGIEAVVVRDTVTEKKSGQKIEDTFDWYAQDSEGNVWYLGEDTTEYENGKPVSKAGSFEAGVDGAQAGVIMPANPEPGLSYRQEYYKGEAEDQASIVSTNEQAEVPNGHFRNVLMTRDINPLHPKVLEFKFFARGVGPVLAIGVSGGSDREELVRFHEAK